MRDLSYWELRGHPKPIVKAPADFGGRGIVLDGSMLAGLTKAERLQVIEKALEAGMGSRPMRAKRR